MRSLRNVFIICVLLAVGCLEILIYWNNHLFYRAEEITNNEKKIRLLRKAVDLYPVNDLVYAEMGKAYFDLGINHISDEAGSTKYLRESIENYKKALKSNPSSSLSHFNFAQSLLYTSYLFSTPSTEAHNEFRKAATLAGKNSYIFFEVSKIFLSRWSLLSDEEKKFTEDILKKIMNRNDEEKIHSLLNVWEMNVKDYSMIKKILPENSTVYRIYADFLGKKHLSLEERQLILAQADYFEFERARDKFEEGNKAFFSFRIDEAIKSYKSCLRILEKIKFYQNLIPENPIDLSEFNEIKKLALLNFAKCHVEKGQDFKDYEIYLQDYLSLENDMSAIIDLESYLKEKGLIVEKLENSFNDLNRMFFYLLLLSKKNRYKEMMRIGRLLQQSFVIIPKGQEKVYKQILDFLGDAYQKSDHIFESSEFYKKSLEIEPHNLETLVRIRSNYERLGNEEAVHQINQEIQDSISSREKVFKNYSIAKGETFTHNLILDDRTSILDIQFGLAEKGVIPLVSLFFNGQVVWENYVREESYLIPVESKPGNNSLEISSLNSPITLIKLSYQNTGN